MLLVTRRRVARRLRRGSRAAALLLVLVSGRARAADDGVEPRASEPVAWLEPGMDAWRGPLGPTALPAAGEVSRAGALWAAVSGGVAASPGERQRFFGLLELGVGLDVWAAPPPPAEAPSEDEDGPAGLAAPPAGVRADAAPTALDPAPRAPRPAAGGARRDDPAVAALLARATVAEALRVQAGAAELSRLDGMAARSRAAASLPEVRIGAGTSQDESLRQSPTLDDPARFTRDGGRDLWFEARLTWRLDGALFTRDEIAIMRLRAQQREDSARLAREVLGALLEWQRARLVLDSPLSSPEERDLAILRQIGAVASLDVLTEGWFSRRLALSRTPLGTAPRAAPSE